MDRLKLLSLAGVLAVAVSMVAAGPAAAKGGNTDNLNGCQNGGWANLYDANKGLRFTNVGGCVSYGARGQAYAGFQLTAQPGGCVKGGSECSWGGISGFGLAPNAPIQVFSSAGAETVNVTTDANGNVGAPLNLVCDFNATGWHAVTTTPTGATITSNAVETPGVECSP
jgi:hypothetical protein